MRLILGKTANLMGFQGQYLYLDSLREETGLETGVPEGEDYSCRQAWVESETIRPYWKQRCRIGNISLRRYKEGIRGLREAERNPKYHLQNS